jgi:hypothetical protein
VQLNNAAVYPSRKIKGKIELRHPYSRWWVTPAPACHQRTSACLVRHTLGIRTEITSAPYTSGSHALFKVPLIVSASASIGFGRAGSLLTDIAASEALAGTAESNCGKFCSRFGPSSLSKGSLGVMPEFPRVDA